VLEARSRAALPAARATPPSPAAIVGAGAGSLPKLYAVDAADPIDVPARTAPSAVPPSARAANRRANGDHGDARRANGGAERRAGAKLRCPADKAGRDAGTEYAEAEDGQAVVVGVEHGQLRLRGVPVVTRPMTSEPTVPTLRALAIRYLRVRKRIILLLCLGGGEIGEKVGSPIEPGADEEA
jgi:hypothetical protein